MASLLPRHALDAARVLSARHAGLPLPRGGLRWLGRGAVAVVSAAAGSGAGSGGGEGARTDKKRARVQDGSREAVRAACASLASVAGSPREAKVRALSLAEAALAPLALDGRSGSGPAAAARVAVRSLAVLSAVQEAAILSDLGKREISVGGGEGDGEEEEEEVEEKDERWDGGALDPPPLGECLRATSLSLARRRLERLADVLELGFVDIGGEGGGGGGAKEAGSPWRKRRAAFAAEVRAAAATAAAASAAAVTAVVAAKDKALVPSAVADARDAASAAGLVPPAWLALALSDPVSALRGAWPVLSVSPAEDAACSSAVAGELLSPGGAHALPLEAVASLPLPLAVVARVSQGSSSSSSSKTSSLDEDCPLWLRVSSPGAETMMLRLRGGGEGGGGGNSSAAAAVVTAATLASSSSSSDAKNVVVLSSRVELPHPPLSRDCTLTLALVARLGWQKSEESGAALPVFARLGAARRLALRVVRQQQQQRQQHQPL